MIERILVRFVACLLLVVVSPISAQDSPGDTPTSATIVLRGEEAAVATSAVFLPAASVTLHAGDDFQPFTFHMDDSTYLDWPNVQTELEMAEEQMKQIQKLREEGFKKMNEIMQARQALGEAVKPGEMHEEMRKHQKSIQDQINGVLLPHQARRLKQVALQLSMKNRGPEQALLNGRVAEELGLTPEQKKEIQEASRENRVRIQKEMQRMKEESRENVLGKLTSSQRKKLEELTGDKMKTQKPSTRTLRSKNVKKPSEK